MYSLIILKNIISKEFVQLILLSGVFSVCVILASIIIFGAVSIVRIDNHISKASDRVIILNDSKKYDEAIYAAENIEIRFAADRNYTSMYSSRFTDIAKLALANSYNQVGKSELATALYLDILGYSEEEYKAMQLLNIQKEI